MALQDAEPMGYAPPAAVRSVISSFRDQGLPTPLTVDSIQRIGVTESLAPRTIQTLKRLRLLDDEGKITEQFERLRRAPTSDFKPELVTLLRSAYASVFEVLEPAGASYEEVQDAFRTFKPEGQRDRMVALFLSLLEYAEYSDNLPTGRPTGGGRKATSVGLRPHKDKPSVRPSNTNPSRAQNPSSPPLAAGSEKGERVEVTLGSAGTVVVRVDVRWLDLPTEIFTELRKSIEVIKALGYEDQTTEDAVGDKDGPSEEGPSDRPSGDGGGVTSP